jgi:hypothetical protein
MYFIFKGTAVQDIFNHRWTLVEVKWGEWVSSGSRVTDRDGSTEGWIKQENKQRARTTVNPPHSFHD